MGKYMKKKSTVTDVSPQQAIGCGIRTRAKTLVLQQTLLPAAPSPATDSSSSLSFLELRSRRLQKPPPSLPKSPSKKQLPQPSARKCCPRATPRLIEPGSFGFGDDGSRRVQNGRGSETGDCVGASFGDNILDSQGTIGRTTRESTPCSFIRDPDSVPTLTNTTRSRRATPRTRSQRVQNDGEVFPRVHEMEEIFDCVEEQQRVSFRNKYNFDIANDQPLPGRFEWVPVV